MIKVYGKPGCAACAKAKTLLENVGVPFEYIDIFENEQAMQMIVDGGFRTVPQIFEDDRLIGDYNALNEHFLLLG